jgi:hypothetical protein
MRATEIIRGVLDIIDGRASAQPDDTVEDTAYSDNDLKRFRQIVDLAAGPDQQEYSNQPNEQYADIDAVTVDAGADSWQGTKHPADIRGEHPSLYPGTVHGAR